MSVISEDVTLDGVKLKRYRSDRDVKIKCVDDGNIYPLAYVQLSCTMSFTESSLPLNEITAGAIVSSDQVLGLDTAICAQTSGMIQKCVRTELDRSHDGIVDEVDRMDLGGA